MKRLLQVVRDVEGHWVGDGFPVRSLFSYAEGAQFDPFLLLDYAGPSPFDPADAARGVGEHPHRGFETVTIVVQGEVTHRDSSGGGGTIGPGDVQWMTAASGVVHEELHGERFTREGGVMEMVQLWVNLPARVKMTSPRYQSLRDAEIPRAALPEASGTARIIAGEAWGVMGAAKTYSPIGVWDVSLGAGKRVDLPLREGEVGIVLVLRGEALLPGKRLGAGQLARLSVEGAGLGVEARGETRLLVLSGAPLGEPIVGHGPFVMNTREEIHQAIRDYQAGRMGRLS